MPTSSNVILSDRFNDGDPPPEWTLDETGGPVSVVTQDFSTKLKLDDTNGSSNVSATRVFTDPETPWILEHDIKHAASAMGVTELLDSSNAVIASATLGATANQIDFDTDNDTPSSQAFNAGEYKQTILLVNPVSNTISFWISEDNTINGSLKTKISKSYSGTAIAKVRFRTDNTATGIIYIDETRIYTPHYFIIGDSIADGKNYWSTHPEFSWRLNTQEDEVSSPAYQLGLLLGSASTTWVANRAFGGSNTTTVEDKIQNAVVDHMPEYVIVAVGHNDIAGAVPLATMQANYNSIIAKLVNGGVSTNKIIMGNIKPANSFDAAENQAMDDWNVWLHGRAEESNSVYANLHDALKDPASPRNVLPSYDSGDGTHLSPAGSAAFAQEIYDALVAKEAKNYTAHVLVRGKVGAEDGRIYENMAPISAINYERGQSGFLRGIGRGVV